MTPPTSTGDARRRRSRRSRRGRRTPQSLSVKPERDGRLRKIERPARRKNSPPPRLRHHVSTASAAGFREMRAADAVGRQAGPTGSNRTPAGISRLADSSGEKRESRRRALSIAAPPGDWDLGTWGRGDSGAETTTNTQSSSQLFPSPQSPHLAPQSLVPARKKGYDPFFSSSVNRRCHRVSATTSISVSASSARAGQFPACPRTDKRSPPALFFYGRHRRHAHAQFVHAGGPIRIGDPPCASPAMPARRTPTHLPRS